MEAFNEQEAKMWFRKSDRIIIKIGTNVLTPHTTKYNPTYFEKLAASISFLQQQKKKVILVSSGAVGLGLKSLSDTLLKKVHKQNLAHRQALASLGQNKLMSLYSDAFEKQGLFVAQVLVSRKDFLNRDHYHNLKNVLETLLSWNVVPIINENDAVSTEELRLGDNDTLSAHITAMHWSSFLIMLTSIDGFYLNKKRLLVVRTIQEKIEKAARGPEAGGIGGMKTKIKAAKKLLQSAQAMVIASGENPDILYDIAEGKAVGTYFLPKSDKGELTAKQRWILHNRHTEGAVLIDKGAEKAILEKRASLLPVGVKQVIQPFEKNAIINVLNQDQKKVARGLTKISSAALEKKMNQKKKSNIELIHRDDLVLL
ncbi:MAG: glutamate 5-kinase [Candidatus Hydrogenedentota bacterium]|nr:MAG: glutamate 5-kinase [Candidatus Hydrogenedentota bacterium]